MSERTNERTSAQTDNRTYVTASERTTVRLLGFYKGAI